MGDIASYRIRDFLLFSKDTLLEIYQGYNLDFWPWQFVPILFIVYSAFSLLKPSKRRFQLMFLGLAAAWVWVALVFHLRYFQPINWASEYFAYAFLVQAFLLVLVSFRPSKFVLTSRPRYLQLAAVTVFLAAALLPIELMRGLDLSHVLIFGWGAERTAAGTFILLLVTTRGWARTILLITPGLWILLSAVVLSALK